MCTDQVNADTASLSNDPISRINRRISGSFAYNSIAVPIQWNRVFFLSLKRLDSEGEKRDLIFFFFWTIIDARCFQEG